MTCRDSLPLYGFILYLNDCFPAQKLTLDLWGLTLSFVAFSSQAKGVSFRKSFPRTISCRALHIFSSNSFNHPGFKLRSWINLGLIFVQGNCYKSHFIIMHVNYQFLQHYLLKMWPFFQCQCVALFSVIRWLQLRVFMLGLPMSSVVLPVCFHDITLYYDSFIIYFDI